VKTLLLGLGNPFVRDDAVGIRLARAARRELGDRPELDWRPECSTGGLDLLPLLEGYDRLLVFDAIRTRGGRPGDWYRFTARELRETRHLDSVHDVNFATALELGRRLGMVLPPDGEIHILAVEILANDEFGQEFSPLLEQAWPGLQREVLAEVRRLLEAETDPADCPAAQRSESGHA